MKFITNLEKFIMILLQEKLKRKKIENMKNKMCQKWDSNPRLQE